MRNRLLLVAFIFCAWIGAASAKDLKVLMIGNSFSNSVGTYLPELVRAYPEHSLELTGVFVGGCTLKQHVEKIKAAEKDPQAKAAQYRISVWYSADKEKFQRYFGNLIDVLKKQPYDIVTIQQGSVRSWDWESYEPYAAELISFIRQCQPNAEIVIHQTWAYRVDAPHFQKFGFDQTEMYNRIRDAYSKLAEKYKLRVIPVGDAVQLFRKYTPIQYEPSTETFEYPKRPSSKGDVVGSARWEVKGEEKKLMVDYIHMNPNGRYLQACVWFSSLYGVPAEKITWVPKKGVSKEMAELLRKCAREALDEYPQVK